MRPDAGPPSPAEAGFTLLETLVALGILGVVLVTLFRLAGDTLVQHQGREAQLRLALAAEAAFNMASLGQNGASPARWPADLTVTLATEDLAAAVARGALALPRAAIGDSLDWLSVTVVDDAGRSFTLAGAVGRAGP